MMMNPALTIELKENQTVEPTEAWTVTEISGGKGYVVNRLPGGERLTLAPNTKPTDGDRLDAVARSRGRRLVNFDPYGRTAILAALPSETERVRDEIAHALNCRPWDVDISLIDDGGNERTIIAWRVPAVPREKRKDRWLSIAADLYAHDDDSLWRWSQQWIAGANRSVLTYARDGLAEVHEYPHDFEVSMSAIPFGVAESGEVVTYPVAENSWLLGGLPGGGKSAGQTTLVVGMAQLENCAIIGVDAKRVEVSPGGPRGGGLAVAIPPIYARPAKIGAEMLRRYKLLEKKGWKKIRPCAETPQIALIIDELAEIVGTGLKENKEVEERISSNVRRLMSLGRAAGVTVQLATQKPSSDIVPTSLRDMVISRVSYACATDAQVDTILGAG
ncbi:MAG: hypothetical protein L0G46_11910, partial [Kocuria sp.]|nr:hypothetical protein [Kocuria sp.]